MSKETPATPEGEEHPFALPKSNATAATPPDTVSAPLEPFEMGEDETIDDIEPNAPVWDFFATSEATTAPVAIEEAPAALPETVTGTQSAVSETTVAAVETPAAEAATSEETVAGGDIPAHEATMSAGEETQIGEETLPGEGTIAGEAAAPAEGEGAEHAAEGEAGIEEQALPVAAKSAGDKRTKTMVLIAGALFVLALGAFTVLFLTGNIGAPKPTTVASAPVTPPAPVTPAPTAATPSKPATPATTSGKPAASATAAPGDKTKTAPLAAGGAPKPAATKPAPKPAAPKPVAPPAVAPLPKPAPTAPVPTPGAIAAAAAAAASKGPVVAPPPVLEAKLLTSARDPFTGGPPPPPPPPPPQPPKPKPSVVSVSAIPSILPTPARHIGPRGHPPKVYPRDPPIGRAAGWIFNNDSGQIVALIDDRDGNAQMVHVGDSISDCKVLAITPEYLLLQDIKGNEVKLKLQGLDTYQGNKGTKNVQANPAAAPAGMTPWKDPAKN